MMVKVMAASVSEREGAKKVFEKMKQYYGQSWSEMEP
jgi:hypothetical protein